jgi:precorrin-2 dehydrogenase/sirohydrochlorin ferrochelatase
VAKEISPEISALEVETARQAYSPDVLEGASLVYACTNDRKLNATVKQDANQRGIMVNVVDDPELCDFITPAVYTGDKFAIAVSTFGSAPSGAAKIRNMIREKLQPEQVNVIVEKEMTKR